MLGAYGFLNLIENCLFFTMYPLLIYNLYITTTTTIYVYYNKLHKQCHLWICLGGEIRKKFSEGKDGHKIGSFHLFGFECTCSGKSYETKTKLRTYAYMLLMII